MAKPRLVDAAQGSICCWKLTGVQHLYACIVVAIERGNGTRAASIDRVCRIREPDSKVVCLRRHSPRVQDESFVIQNPRYVHHALALRIGRDVTLIPGRNERCVGRSDDEQGEVYVWGKGCYLYVHVLYGSKIADGDPSASAGAQTSRSSRRPYHAEDNAVIRGRRRRGDKYR